MKLVDCLINTIATACTSPFALGNSATLFANIEIDDAGGNPVVVTLSVAVTCDSGNCAAFSIAGSPATTSSSSTTTQFSVEKTANANTSAVIRLHVTTAGFTIPDITFTVQKR